jgi:hypothetical protein
MERIADNFARKFAHWDITLPEENVRHRRRGRIVQAGWTIWYLFGRDERGEYLDYYACHRMTNDRHVRLYENGDEQTLEALMAMRICSGNPVEDARLEAEYVARNQQIRRNLQAKGLALEGN